MDAIKLVNKYSMLTTKVRLPSCYVIQALQNSRQIYLGNKQVIRIYAINYEQHNRINTTVFIFQTDSPGGAMERLIFFSALKDYCSPTECDKSFFILFLLDFVPHHVLKH